MRSPLFVCLPLTAALCACGSSSPPSGADSGVPETCMAAPTATVGLGLSVTAATVEPLACRETITPGASPPKSCTQRTPDLSCVGKTVPRGTPINVTFRGCLTVFGINANYTDLAVAVFRERDPAGAAVDPGYDVSGQAGMQADNTPTALVARGLTHEVREAECPELGAFELMNVPTETELIVRVTHQNEQSSLRQFVDTYQYNYSLRNSAITDQAGAPVADPATTCRTTACYARDDINTIAIATFRTIPRAAGVGAIQGESDLFDGNGQGHIAGEVQDCSSADKVQNAVVAIDTEARKLTYFNVGFTAGEGNLEDPKPSSTRNRTNADGLYAAIGVNTMRGGKPVTVGAAVLGSLCGPDNVCKCTADGQPNAAYTGPDRGEGALALGSRTVYVFPDSITIMTFDRALYEKRQ